MDSTLFGTRLREARKARGWTLAQLADAAGLHLQSIARYECSPDRGPTWDAACRLASALGVKLDWLAGDAKGGSAASVSVVGPLAPKGVNVEAISYNSSRGSAGCLCLPGEEVNGLVYSACGTLHPEAHIVEVAPGEYPICWECQKALRKAALTTS